MWCCATGLSSAASPSVRHELGHWRSDRLTAWLRSTVPAAWSALVAYVVTLGAPVRLTDGLGYAGPALVVPLVLATVHALLRWCGPWRPHR